ncbi:MAG: ferrochelatase [Propioniciclava sp.]
MTRPMVVLVNLGTPTAPTAGAVRPFLREFLGDQRVVGLPRILWQPILNGIILAVRPRASARLYASIWGDGGSPLMVGSQHLGQRLGELLADHADVRIAMTYGQPSVDRVLDELIASAPERPIVVVPLYPQYAGSATGAVHDAVHRWGLRTVPQADLRLLRSFPTHPAYLDAVADAITAHWERVGPLDTASGERLLLSYHGIPMSQIRAGDPYPEECATTSRGLRARLDIDPAAVMTTYQSKFGPGAWLKPATIDTVADLGARGTRRIDVVAPGFAADCLETLEELNKFNRRTFTDAGGGDFHYVPWANSRPAWVAALASIVTEALPAGHTPGPTDTLEA